MTFVSELEPTAVWRRFDEILTVYRPSKGEEAMSRYVVGVAEDNGLEHRTDDAGNLVVAVPGTAGHEDAAVTVLQAHLDMVYEKNSDVDHDFATDPIVAERQDGYLTARGTTLGSDNGMGVAAMLALMDASGGDGDVEHGPLELLFTLDEETGLTGAGELSPDLLTGRRLLNLDTEEEGALYVGCAGGLNSKLTLPLTSEATPDQATALTAKLSGLKGGHSGVDIHLQRGNAIKLLARALGAAVRAVRSQVDGSVNASPVRLAGFSGGSSHNAIPREAEATVVLEAGAAVAFKSAFDAEAAAIRAEYRPADPGAEFEITPGRAPQTTWDGDTTMRVLGLVNALPHGVMTMSYDIPDLVETSTTLATVGEHDNELEILLSSRSSVDSAIRFQARRVRAVAELAGARTEEEGAYPGWKPDMDSALLATVRRVHEQALGDDPEIKAIHAGLECGIIGEKYPGMEMISFGPQIEFPHSPDERVLVDSVDRFWKLLRGVLAALG